MSAMFTVYRTTESTKAHCTGCDTDVRAVVEIAPKHFMCSGCLADATGYLFRGNSFFDNFSYIHELADKLSMELGKLQKHPTLSPQGIEGAYVLSLAAHGTAEQAGISAQMSQLDSEVELRKLRFELLKKEQDNG